MALLKAPIIRTLDYTLRGGQVIFLQPSEQIKEWCENDEEFTKALKRVKEHIESSTRKMKLNFVEWEAEINYGYVTFQSTPIRVYRDL